MKQVLIQRGKVLVVDVPAPVVDAKKILVRVRHSCISIGTELTGLITSNPPPLYKRVLEKPHSVKRFLDYTRDRGIKQAWNLVSGAVAPASPTGYSAAGEVVETGGQVIGFEPGDLVACAGAEIANHAELINVPVNLAVKIPTALSTELASTVTLGAIAVQGVRRCNPTLGETIFVIGLGILGQITAQLLRANGCYVIGVDLDSGRVARARENGLTSGIDPGRENAVERVHELTDGVGADAVIITAATSSNQVVSDAMNACRKKGRVILVGDVGLHLNRQDFYKKELDFFISCSYGPGRYDPGYEEQGHDYPLPYVRWTENRNMETYLRLLSEGRIQLSGLPSQTYSIDDATKAYEAIRSSSEKPFLVYLQYPSGSHHELRRTVVRKAAGKTGRTRVAVVGAGGFAQGMHLPNLMKLRSRYEIRAVVSRDGPKAVNIARQYEAAYATTEFEQVLNDKEVDLIIICTRHNLHGPMVLQALRAGKHVLVEKPLCIKPPELEEIKAFFAEAGEKPVLTTGFNRRFAPPVRLACQWLKERNTPLIINYRMNAGYIPLDHWVHGEEGGGRNIGEACHIYDVFNFLVDSEVTSVHAAAISPDSKKWSRSDNFVATLDYRDGSICTLTYTALGAKSCPKERMEIFGDSKAIILDDFKSLVMFGAKENSWRSAALQKGHLEELECLADCFQSRTPWPIPLEQQVAATEASFTVQKQIQ